MAYTFNEKKFLQYRVSGTLIRLTGTGDSCYTEKTSTPTVFRVRNRHGIIGWINHIGGVYSATVNGVSVQGDSLTECAARALYQHTKG